MVNKKRLIDANALSDEVDKSKHNNPHSPGMVRVNHRNEHDHFLRMIYDSPTVDAVEVDRLGKLGRLMMPYNGCPRGDMGPRGCSGEKFHIVELDPIQDVEGNRWIPVLEEDLRYVKARVDDAAEVVHEHCDWCKSGEELCGTCRRFFDYYGDGGSDRCSAERRSHKCAYYEPIGFCPNCGSMMDGGGKADE